MATKPKLELPTIEVVEGTIKQQRSAYGAGARQAIADEKRAAIVAGMYLTLGKATFTADETDEWKDWATSVTRKSIKTVDSYIAVAKAYSSSTRALQSKVSDWTFEALQAYASVDPDDRAAVVAAVVAEDSNPSPELVRTARDIAKDEKLTDAERSEKDAAKRKRDRQRDEDKTTEMVKALAPILNRFKTDAEFKAFSAGVEMGLAHKDAKLIERGVKQYRTQRDKASEVVAKAAEKVAAKAAAK